jgi:HK97 gp10 family phage protein
MPPVTFQGNWNFIGETSQRLSRNEGPTREKVSSEMSDLYLIAIRDLINSNGEGENWQITTKWANKKVKLNEGDKIYIATGTFLSKLRKVKLSNGAYAAGAFSSDQYDEKLNMAQLAFYLEFGTRDMPARPLFRPAFQKIKDPATRRMLEEITKTVKDGKGQS